MNDPVDFRFLPAWRGAGVLALCLALAACDSGGGGGLAGDAAPPMVGGPQASAGVACKDMDGNPVMVSAKTITIHNNSAGVIYPVLSTSKNAVNQWIQGCLRTAEPYPTDHVYKLYVNEGQGIPAGSSVTMTLPLYSELSPGRYVTWWNGGRVVLADRGDRLRDPADTSVPAPAEVVCQGQKTACALSLYASAVQFPENIYAQLSEYTFGDSIIPEGQKLRLLKPENVGYNISYVDHVYMPVAIGPKNNPYIGYSGSVQPLAGFRNQLSAFLANPATGEGWPVYNLDALKLPGGYNIFAQRSGTLPPDDLVPVKPAGGFPPVLTVLKCVNGQCADAEKASLHFGQAVQRMQNLWGSCVDWAGEDLGAYVTQTVSCSPQLRERLSAVKQFFVQNHKNYLALVNRGACPVAVPEKPKFTFWEAMTHIYGWVPFNEGCGANENPLSETSIPGWNHAKIQSMYIHELQYNHQQAEVQKNPDFLFNPYVQLIHDKLGMNAYGFSVDDAVGFMSELGDGLIFAVGGAAGLENPQQFDYADGFSLAIGVPKSKEGRGSEPLLKRYGVCVFNQDPNDPDCTLDKQDMEMPAHSQVAGFRVGTVSAYPIRVRFTDMEDNQYSIKVNTRFSPCTEDMDIKQCPANGLGIVDKTACLVTTPTGEKHPNSDDWCVNANPNQQREKQLTKNYLSYPKPVGFSE
ncbi:hypothetical protein ACMHYJ_16300 [Castellaniella hirudinis]|uniref:hypothetical protein n=1 Tax=Castellaniella hirudinis TaxID=1144617 RepID=UPI0039C0FA27